MNLAMDVTNSNHFLSCLLLHGMKIPFERTISALCANILKKEKRDLIFISTIDDIVQFNIYSDLMCNIFHYFSFLKISNDKKRNRNKILLIDKKSTRV
jgi:hypothetical protein